MKFMRFYNVDLDEGALCRFLHADLKATTEDNIYEKTHFSNTHSNDLRSVGL